MKNPPVRAAWSALLAVALAVASAPAVVAQSPQDFEGFTGEALYAAACANCHGTDGRGLPQSLVGFAEELPDFTDCDFAVREPVGDWVAVAHQGGPVRGFSRMMPAFGEALSVGQLERVIGYVRTMCTDPEWPEGELNLPRALLTEKAYPEDEWVVESEAALGGPGSLRAAYVYERRFGPRSQWEVVLPVGWEGSEDGTGGAGLGDLVVGLKHAAYHDGEAGSILSVGAEAVLPTGSDEKGLGSGSLKTELFTSFGKILPSDGFFQAQAGVELPLTGDAEKEGFLRAVFGRTVTEGDWGRSWSPMLELAAKRDLESGAQTKLDVVPQVQFSLNQRQHVLANVGLLVPVTSTEGRSVRLVAYVLLDWFDGGFFEGW